MPTQQRAAPSRLALGVLLLALMLLVSLTLVSNPMWTGVQSQNAYNATYAARLVSLVRSHSHYYSLSAPRNHRAYVGGKW